MPSTLPWAPCPLSVRKLRNLEVEKPAQTGRGSFVATGSALVKVGKYFYVAPDDQLEIARFRTDTAGPGKWVHVLRGTLPLDAAERKKQKPDWEMLALLPAFDGASKGALMVLPSGSRDNRDRGAFWPLKDNGELKGRPVRVDFGPLYKALLKSLPELNLEGSAVIGRHTLRLLNRGNAGTGPNAIVDLDLDKVLRCLKAHEPLDASVLKSVRKVDLGLLQGTKLTFSDAAALPDGRIVFSATAEATDSTFEDGKSLGSAIGVLSRRGKVLSLAEVPDYKVEGVFAEPENGHWRLWMTSDADDPTVPSPLLTAQL
jgi:hypothetical protein